MKPTLLLIPLLSAGLSFASAQEKQPEKKPAQEEVKRPEGQGDKPHHDKEHNDKPQPKKHGPEMRPTTFLGVVTRAPSPEVRAMAGMAEGFGLVVEEVMPESPASTAKVQRYDLLTHFNDQQLVNTDQLSALVRSAAKDTEATLTLKRAGSEQKVTVKLTEKMMPVAMHPPHGEGHFFGNMFNKEHMHRMGQDMKDRFHQFQNKVQEKAREFRRPDDKKPGQPHLPQKPEGKKKDESA